MTKLPAKEGPASAWSASELLERCQAHDEGAWQEFLRRYARLIYSAICRRGLSQPEQDDAFQATIIAIYRDLSRLRDPQSLVAWIVSIAWRQSINVVRHRSREIGLADAGGGDAGTDLDPPAADAPPDEVLLSLERAQQAQQALLTLGERCRRLLAYFFYEDPAPDYAEIARREGVPIGSLGPTRARCLAQMRRYFEEQGWA
jgi:RNA polymerase sigma factor (sigma-70 family)